MPEYLALSQIDIAACQQLAEQSKRVGLLLTKHKNSKTSLLACLDDLLGAVYNLFYATHFQYSDRLKPLAEPGNVLAFARFAHNGWQDHEPFTCLSR